MVAGHQKVGADPIADEALSLGTPAFRPPPGRTVLALCAAICPLI